MNSKNLLVIILLFFCNYSIPVYSFDDQKTHRELTDAATVNSNLINYLITNIGFGEGLDKTFKGIDRKGYERTYSVSKWLQDGSEDEDNPLCRATNHFHNPIHDGDWTQSKMSDSILVPIYSFIFNCGTKYSNVTWATGYTAPISGYAARNGQKMGWDNARTYFYEALTATDPRVKEAKFVKTFKSVGMVTHLLQDMAVPAHVRNDMTSHLINSTKWGGNPFEIYVVGHSSAISSTPLKPEFATPVKLTDYWDADVYSGDTPYNIANRNQGLAEYSNANFVSDNTLFKSPSWDLFGHSFTYPAETSTTPTNVQIQDPLYPLDPSKTITRKYFMKTGDGETGYKLAGVGYINAKIPTIQTGKAAVTYKDLPPMDDYVHEDYANRLLPRAVGYSASMLDYFFRGKLEVSQNPSTSSNMRFMIKNTTPGEEMTGGKLVLVLRYREFTESDTTLISPPQDADFRYKVIELTSQTVSSSMATEYAFPLYQTLPVRIKDLAAQVVYQGTLGNEANAVAVSPWKTVQYKSEDIELKLPSTGVYAATTGTTPFTEISLKARNNLPNGETMTDGTISLYLLYRTATTDPFQSVQVTKLPADGYTQTKVVNYVPKVVNIGISVRSLPTDYPVELHFDLSANPLPLWATDVYLYVVYEGTLLDSDGVTTKPDSTVIGKIDISEPTPIDVFNNADKICINSTWYTAGSPEAIAMATPDLFEPYGHNIYDIFVKDSSSASEASSSNYTFSSPSVLTGNSFRRLGYILTDYSFNYSVMEGWINTDPNDPWTNIQSADQYPGTAVKNQTDADGTNIWPGMYTIRGKKMWWGAGVIWVNEDYPAGSYCDWNTLP